MLLQPPQPHLEAPGGSTRSLAGTGRDPSHPHWVTVPSGAGRMQVGLGASPLCLRQLASPPTSAELRLSLDNKIKCNTEQRVTQNQKQRNHNTFSLAKRQKETNYADARTPE